MAKQRELSEPEQKARQECGGLTRRQWRAKNSKFANQPPKTSSGSYEIVAMFDGNPVPQTTPFPNILAALERFIRLSSNSNVYNLKVVENQVIRGADNQAIGMRQVALYTLVKNGQEFCNSKFTTIYRDPQNNSMLTMKAIKASDRLLQALHSNKLEVVKHQAEGGEAWWERRA